MKWYHWAGIVGALVLLYLVLSPKSTILGTQQPATATGWGGTLGGLGKAFEGASSLWDSMFNKDEASANGED